MACVALVARAEPLAAPASTPDELLAAHAPTFVVGTLGDASCDAHVRAEAEALRDSLFPDSAVVDDAEVLASGQWPELAIVYGGEQVNALLASVGAGLPARVTEGEVRIGGKTFEGDDLRLIAAFPARTGDLAHPAFIAYAGTGIPGTAHVNAVKHGHEPWLLADRFGRWKTGSWVDDGRGGLRAVFGPDAAVRPEWRVVERPAWPRARRSVMVRVAMLAERPPSPQDEAVIEACVRGVRRAATRLGVQRPPVITVHVYPDAATKRRVTSRPGAGHADVNSRTLHVLAVDPAPGGSLERLVLHEAVHVIADAEWGPAGTELMGEGLAVWAAGSYGGKRLNEWRPELPSPGWSVEDLLGRRFRRLPEEQAYPAAGLLAGALVRRLGLAVVARELLPATPRTWDAACERAGLPPGEVDRLFRLALEPGAAQKAALRESGAR